MSNTISKTNFTQSLQNGVAVRDSNLESDLTNAGVNPADVKALDTDNDGVLAGTELDAAFRYVDSYDRNGSNNSFSNQGKSGAVYSALQSNTVQATQNNGTQLNDNERQIHHGLTNWGRAVPGNLADQKESSFLSSLGIKDAERPDAEGWREIFHKVPQNGNLSSHSFRHMDAALKDASPAERERAVDAWVQNNSQAGAPLEKFSDAERADLSAGLTSFLADKSKTAEAGLFHPSGNANLPVPGQGTASNSQIDAWNTQAKAELSDVYQRNDISPSGNNYSGKLHEYHTMRIDAATEMYRAASSDLESNLPAQDNIRQDYVNHLRDNPGDLLGAYDEIQGRMTSRQANRIAYGIGSHPWQDSDPYANGWE